MTVTTATTLTVTITITGFIHVPLLEFTNVVFLDIGCLPTWICSLHFWAKFKFSNDKQSLTKVYIRIYIEDDNNDDGNSDPFWY